MRAAPRSTLLPSIITLVSFYGALALSAWFFLPPEMLSRWLAKHGVVLEIDVLNTLSVQTEILTVWGARALLAWGVGVVAGIALIGLLVLFLRQLWKRRGAPAKDTYRGVGITLDRMARPAVLPAKAVQCKLPGTKLGGTQQRLADVLLGILAANRGAFAGDGHGVDLYDHTINVLTRALNLEGADPLLPLAAIAHDIGKLTAYQVIGGNHVAVRHHDRESGRILANLSEWWDMPLPDRHVLLLAVRYEHAMGDVPSSYPDLSAEDLKRVNLLIGQLREIDGLATQDEKKEVLADLPLPEMVLRAFMDTIPVAPFQVPQLAPGIAAVGWRVGNRIWVIEQVFRELAIKRLHPDVAAALGGEHRASGRLHPFTENLLAVLQQRRWLMLEAESAPSEQGEIRHWTLKPSNALWDIRSGKKTFKAVFAVDIPPEHRQILPRETRYTLEVLNPHFMKAVVKTSTTTADGTVVPEAPASEESAPKEQSRPDKGKEKGKRKGNKATPSAEHTVPPGLALSPAMLAAMDEPEPASAIAEPAEPPEAAEQVVAVEENSIDALLGRLGGSEEQKSELESEEQPTAHPDANEGVSDAPHLEQEAELEHTETVPEAEAETAPDDLPAAMDEPQSTSVEVVEEEIIVEEIDADEDMIPDGLDIFR